MLASFINEAEKDHKLTFFTFRDDYRDEQIHTRPEYIPLSFTDKLWRRAYNKFFQKKKITEFHLKRKNVFQYLKDRKTSYDLIIAVGLDDVGFLRAAFPASTIIYWIHGISAIYNKEYLKHINKVDYLWSPTKTIYKKIMEELHPLPFLAEFERIPNWAEPFFDVPDEKMIAEIQKHHHIDADSKIFIFCGGDNKLKGWFLLNRALKKLAEKNNTDLTVIVTGGSKRKDEIYSERVRIIYAGMLEPKLLSAYYRIAEFGLFPSLGGYEHAPVTLIEMIKCNILPIASDVGGVKEMLGADYLFLIDAPHSVETWVSSIENVIALKEEEKCRLLSALHKKMEDYKRKDFKLLLNDIFTNKENTTIQL